MNRTACLFGLGFGLLPAFAHAAVLSDNFDDGVTAPAWTVVQDDPSLRVAEQNGHLEVLSTASNSPNNDALYLSNGPAGFRLSTASDFQTSIDYVFTGVTGTAPFLQGVGLVFGVGRDLDGTDSAAVGYGYLSAGSPLGSGAVGTRVDDVQTQTPFLLPNTGRFVIQYAAATDTLTFSVGTATTSSVGLVRGTWGASDVLVSFGARGNGYSTNGVTAYFDNFSIDSGTLVPEPSLMTAGVLGCLALRRRRALI